MTKKSREKQKKDGLSPEVKKMMLEFFRVASNYPESQRSKEFRRKIREGEYVTCPETKKVYDSAEVGYVSDDFNNSYKILLHPSRRLDLSGMCPVACIQCREIVAWVAPGKDKDGFVREKGKVHHITRCPNCEPMEFIGRETVTELLEKTLYKKYVYGEKPNPVKHFDND